MKEEKIMTRRSNKPFLYDLYPTLKKTDLNKKSS